MVDRPWFASLTRCVETSASAQRKQCPYLLHACTIVALQHCRQQLYTTMPEAVALDSFRSIDLSGAGGGASAINAYYVHSLVPAWIVAGELLYGSPRVHPDAPGGLVA